MKKHLKQVLFGTVLLMAFWSCSLEEIETPEQSTMLDPIPLAQAFYETEKPKQGNFYGRIISDLEVFPYWEGAKSYSDGRILIVPAHRKVKATYAQGYLRRLVFQLDESGEVIRGGILEMAGKDGDFLLDHEEVLIEGFLSGVKSSQLTYLWSDFGSKPLDGMQANGRTVERSVDRLLNSKKGTEGFSFENCIDWYWVYSIGGVVVYEEYSHTTCGSGSCDTNSQDACLDDGTYGGGGGNSATAYKITNNVTDNCMSEQVEKSVDSNFKNRITNLIRDVFGESEEFNIIFENSDLNDNSLDGITGTSFTNSAITFIITLNDGALGSASKEYIMVTVFHELLHAYMGYLGLDPTSNTSQHELMANEYLNLLSGALSEHFNLSSTDANHLAWGGLHGSSKWNQLSQNQKNQIIQTNQQYKSGQKGASCQN